ncbi:unnamed protein product [Periconia digitata]|uniref:Uncharacterized protein n=1 Tax=Periconia digitata TaxID=1303443 RepID=A0A9W4XZB3_9PLEO|nr:unnamed protein product [Periconia digitata]
MTSDELSWIIHLATLLLLHRSARHKSNKTSPKGTLLFLSAGILCLAIAQASTSASVALQTDSSTPATITHAFSLHYRGSFNTAPAQSSTTSVSLSFLNAFAFIVETVCLNGAVWLHSSHATANGLAVGQPSRVSVIGNSLLLVVMAGTGFASWGLGMSADTPSERYGSVLQDHVPSRVVYTVFRACVVVATASVAGEAWRRFAQVKAHSSRQASERPILTRLALLAVPVLILRSIFIVLDIALLWVSNTYPNWSYTTQEAIAFLLIIFGPYAEIWVFAIVCWGGWSMSKLRKGEGAEHDMVMSQSSRG